MKPGTALFQSIQVSPAVMNKPKQSKELGYTPTEFDVLCGRGSSYYFHEGNRRFRLLIQDYLERYTLCKSKMDKSGQVLEIVALVRGSGGHFLRKGNDQRWHDIGDKLAREKIGHAFRDAIADQRREKKQKGSKKELRLRKEATKEIITKHQQPQEHQEHQKQGRDEHSPLHISSFPRLDTQQDTCLEDDWLDSCNTVALPQHDQESFEEHMSLGCQLEPLAAETAPDGLLLSSEFDYFIETLMNLTGDAIDSAPAPTVTEDLSLGQAFDIAVNGLFDN